MLLNARQIERTLGKEKVILLAIEDITARKINENELSIAKAEAERANVAKSEFLSRMSHELRTPMNSIFGFAQLMSMGELNPANKKGVNQILKSGKHLLELINEVLDIAKS
jgi:signal transduction histidine kinase